MTRLGRKPTGTKLLDKFTASPRAQARMRAILQTVSGEKTIREACAELGLGEAMFHRIRAEALAAALEALEPKPMGRPRTATTPSSAAAALEQENSAWRGRRTRDQLHPRPRGRRSTRSSRNQRNAVVHFINDRGPCVGLPTLRAAFPTMRRAELADRLTHYRTACRRIFRAPMSRLTWLRVGAVWAMDFVQPPELIDGRFPFLLSIMDLASRFTLLWSPVPHEDAATVLTHLADLFRAHGAPLVLKCDNGSAFLSDSLKTFLTRWLVCALYSPPRRPQYNGACERNNGCLKSQTHHAASLSSHADWWSSQDTDAARAILNTTVRPWGHAGPTPDDRWRTREPLSEDERTSLRTLVATNQREVRLEMNHPLDDVLDHYPQAAVDRIATQRALVTQGLLKVSRRLITLPLKQLKLAKIL